jgi:phosphoribosylanthranilate isomerase
MSKIIIKASEIGNLTDARYFSAWGVDWLGFSLDSENPAYIGPTQISAMREWLSGPGIVAEMGPFSDAELLLQAVEILKPDALQIGQFTALEAVKTLDGSLTIIKEQIPDSLDLLADLEFEWREWAGTADFFLLNLEKNGFSWSELKKDSEKLGQLKNLCANFSVMLSTVFDATELSEIIETLKPYGISVKGGEEEKVGMKSYDELDAFFETLEEINH